MASIISPATLSLPVIKAFIESSRPSAMATQSLALVVAALIVFIQTILLAGQMERQRK